LSFKTHLRAFYLSQLSSPPADRLVYQAIARYRPGRIVEIGLGTGQRAVRMIEAASTYVSPGEIHYTGMDLFEARDSLDGPGLPLKLAHRMLKRTGATVRLVPGDAFSALARAANTLAGTELLVIAGGGEPQTLKRAWFFVPRMLTERTLVLLGCGGLSEESARFRRVGRAEIERLAEAARVRRVA